MLLLATASININQNEKKCKIQNSIYSVAGHILFRLTKEGLIFLHVEKSDAPIDYRKHKLSNEI